MESKGLGIWKLIFQVAGVIIALLPFIPNAMWYLQLHEDKHPVDWSDGFFVLVGFVFVFGSKNFGSWANTAGRKMINKIK